MSEQNEQKGDEILRMIFDQRRLYPARTLSDFASDEGYRSALSINIPQAVIETAVTETVKRLVSLEIDAQMKSISRNMIVSYIIIPLAIFMSFTSFIASIIMYLRGATIISVPFLLVTIFGIYYLYLKKARM